MQLLEPVVHGALRARQGDAQGARGAPAAARHPTGAAPAAALRRHRLGHRQEVHLLR